MTMTRYGIEEVPSGIRRTVTIRMTQAEAGLLLDLLLDEMDRYGKSILSRRIVDQIPPLYLSVSEGIADSESILEPKGDQADGLRKMVLDREARA